MRYIHLKSQSFGKLWNASAKHQPKKYHLRSERKHQLPVTCYSVQHVKITDSTIQVFSHLVELPKVLLLRLVDYSQDSGDGLADNAAVNKGKADNSAVILQVIITVKKTSVNR